MKDKLVIYWSRRDFRLRDNPALSESLKYSKEHTIPFLPVFILEDYMYKNDPLYQFGYPSRYFLMKALPLWGENFKEFLLVHGKGSKYLKYLATHFDIKIFVNEDVYPDFYTQIEKLKKENIDITVCRDMMTIDKDTRSGTGSVYSIFTPFKNAVWQEFIEAKEYDKVNPENIKYLDKENLKKLKNQIENKEEILWEKFSKNRKIYALGETFDIDKLIPYKPDLENWYFDENTALKKYSKYLKENIDIYKKERDYLDREKTSKMSLGLAWGLLSSRTLKNMILKHYDTNFENPYSIKHEDATHYISELIWREFYKYLFYHYPNLMNEEFQMKFRRRIKWADKDKSHERFLAWIKGETGYAVVDAAMIELARTGYMHNRARMIVASVLTKNLGVDWRAGQEYFRCMLIDLDEASNNGGWQWGASTGADPKPIRIFNPYLQAENYDSENIYQGKWLGKEKLAKYLTTKELKKIDEIKNNNLFEDNKDRIYPIVPHEHAREEALKRYGLDGKKSGRPRDY
ncbi:MAG: deoxyribodipyrimidine photo-lyase [Candidatus Paceibacterota bacterium]